MGTLRSLSDAHAMSLAQLTLSPLQVAGNTTAEQIFPLPGVRTGDFVQINKPSAQAGLFIANVRVSSNDNIGITFGNATGSPITPTAAEVYLVMVWAMHNGGTVNYVPVY